MFLRDRGNATAAEPLLREALAVANAIPEVRRSPQRAIYLRNYAALLLDTGRPAAAEPLIREALSIFQEVGSDLRIADAESVLGGCLAAQGRIAEGEPLLRGSWEALKEMGDEGARYREQARQRLTDFTGLPSDSEP